MRPLLLVLVLLLPLSPTAALADASAQEAALWAALREGGHVALMRHALAPGTGDPPGFRVDDCRTQRNLSAAGRAQARAIGERFRANGIAAAAVFSSQWCRCLDTARELALGEVRPHPALNSSFGRRGEEADQTRAARALIAEQSEAGTPLVLVTHQVNITALTGVFPASGELIVMRVEGDALSLAGRIATAP
ncbi:histidine phosphatase family protein [Thauera sp.]|uniref:histidine phosphatase family protein n=1 Tax=Thauera sp. TaxID=1905334 RepID=UPI002BA22439|nr:histidine phosphatase family protein [Thauera sp.]HRP24081.1 histidine phosphatase family protein [Thauera sp.]